MIDTKKEIISFKELKKNDKVYLQECNSIGATLPNSYKIERNVIHTFSSNDYIEIEFNILIPIAKYTNKDTLLFIHNHQHNTSYYIVTTYKHK